MRRDWGWIELLTPVTAAPYARGHLFAIESDADGTWRCELESLRLAPGKPALHPGHYIARFERGHEYQRVSVRVTAGGAEVRGEDHELPAVALELAEGE